jgi:hypothetical protein
MGLMALPDDDDDEPSELESLRRRVVLLEEDNQRLRDKLRPILGGPENPAFDPNLFMRKLGRINLLMLPAFLLMGLAMPLLITARQYVSNTPFGPFIDFAGLGTPHPGHGFGVNAFGGLSVGAIAMGGGAFGLVAFGGGAFGIVAIGGGAVGVFAFGGGAVGYIAIGGGAAGYYALGQKAAGKYVLALNRQDDEAIEFFCRYFPSLRAAVTRPMPVLPAAAATAAATATAPSAPAPPPKGAA